MAKYLDKTGVQTLWDKMKSYVDSKDVVASKLKYIASRSYISYTGYRKLATFNVNDATNASSLMIQGVIGDMSAEAMTYVSLVLGNRDNFNGSGVVSSTGQSLAYSKVDLVAYQETDGSNTLYLKINNWYRYALFVSPLEDTSFVYNEETITSPTGTLVWQLSTQTGSGIITN